MKSALTLPFSDILSFYFCSLQECSAQKAGNTISQIRDWSKEANHLDVISIGDQSAFFSDQFPFFNFNGSSDYFQRDSGDCTNLDPLGNSFTIAAWFKTTSAIMVRIATKHAGVGYWWFRKVINNNRIQIYLNDGSSAYDNLSVSGGYNDGAFHLAVAVIDQTANLLRLNIDNSEEPTVDITAMGSINSAPGDFRVGKYTTDFWDGLMSEVMVFNAALTVAQIDYLYKNSFSRRLGVI